MRPALQKLLLTVMLSVGIVSMFFALFVETAASSTNDYRLGMVLGLAFASIADALFYWAFANGRTLAKGLALLAGLPASLFIAFDWLTRGVVVFGH